MQKMKMYIPVTNHELLGLLLKKERLNKDMLQSTVTNGVCKREVLSNLENGNKVKVDYYYIIANKLEKPLVIDNDIDNQLNELVNDIYNNCYYLNNEKLKENKNRLELILVDVKNTLYYEAYYNILLLIIDYFIYNKHQDNYDEYFDIYNLFNDKITELISIVFYMYYYLVNFDNKKMEYYIDIILKYNSHFSSYYKIYNLSAMKNYLVWINEYDKIENELFLYNNYPRLIKLYIYKLSFIDILGEDLGDTTLNKALYLIENNDFDDKHKANCYYNRGMSLIRRSKYNKAIDHLKKYLLIKNNTYVTLIIACIEHKLVKNLENDDFILIEYFKANNDKDKIKLIPKIMKELKQINHYPLINAFKHECYYICKKESHYKLYFDYMDKFKSELHWEVK